MLPYKAIPVLFSLGSINVYSYGLMYALAIIIGSFIILKVGENRGLNKDKLYNLIVVVLVSQFIGARLFYIFAHYDYYLTNPLDILKIWQGGLIFYGGFLFGLLAAYVYVKKNQLNLLKHLDAIAVGLPLGFAIGRIGCFLRGCCYGLPTKLPWGILSEGQVIHPTQLYYVLAGLIIFTILFILRKTKYFDGFLFWIFILMYTSLSFVIEFFRYYEVRVWIFSVSQLFDIVFFIIALCFIIKRMKFFKKTIH